MSAWTANLTTTVCDSCLSDHDTNRFSAQFYVKGVAVPVIGVLGVVGNLLILAILSWMNRRRENESLEKVALVCLIAVAASDMFFCFTVLPNLSYWEPKSLFTSRSFALYFRLYSVYVHNVFIKTSTWLTMIVATAQYVGVYHPLRARMFFGLLPAKIAVIFTFVFWVVFLSPMLWTYTYFEFQTGGQTAYIIDLGEFSHNATMKITFTYLWAMLGYFVPMAILAFCNIRLIMALRETRIIGESVVVGELPSDDSRKHNRSITITLVALVMMFMLLVSPSELLHFCHTINLNKDTYAAFELGVLITNVLQAINFAFHLVLYCAVNITFRKTLFRLVCMPVSLLRTSQIEPTSRKYSSSHESTFNHSALNTKETHI